MGERQRGRAAHVLLEHLIVAVERRERTGGPSADDVAAHPIDAQLRAGAGDPQQLALGEPHAGHALPRGGDPFRERGLRLLPARGEGRRVPLEGQAPAHDLRPYGRVRRPADLDAQPEAVEQLRAQLALLRVHRADEQEAGVVLDRDGVALDPGDRRGGRVEQRVDEVVGQQVDLVDVEDPLVRAGQHAGLERPLAGERTPEVQRAHEPVERRAQRQLDQRRRARPHGRVGRHYAAGRALAGPERERLALRREDRRQQRGQRPNGGRLRRAALAAHQHPADLRGNRVDQQRLDERLLAHDRAEWESRRHAPASSSSPSSDRNRSRIPASVASFGSPHRPRSAASSRRSAIARAAHGFERPMNAATSSSST
jgi:hypothetical protein